jgi:hypothetical protein
MAKNNSDVSLQFNGGKYTAIQQDNGNWSIKDIPIFIEHTYEDGEVFDSKWMREALAKSQQRLEQDGYRAPLHANHHRPGEKVERIGEFIPTRIAPMTYEGKEVNAIYADFVNITPENYERIKRGEFPYRSVEIPPKRAEIVSLALLSDKVPYFRFSNLEIGKEIKNEMALMFSGESAENPEIIFNFKGVGMADAKKGKLPKDDEKVSVRMDEGADGKKKDEEKKEEGKQMQAEGGDKMDMVIEMLKQLLAAVAGKAGETPAEETQGELAPVQMSAKLEGIITAQENRIKLLEKKHEVNGRLEAARNQLKGYMFDDATLVKYSDNEAALTAFVAAVKQYGAKDNPMFFAGVPAAKRKDEPKEVACYEAEGAEKLAKARKFNRMYEELILANPSFGQTVNRESFIKDQFACDAMIGATEEEE